MTLCIASFVATLSTPISCSALVETNFASFTHARRLSFRRSFQTDLESFFCRPRPSSTACHWAGPLLPFLYSSAATNSSAFPSTRLLETTVILGTQPCEIT